MSVISIFSATHCHGDDVARSVAEKLGYDHINDDFFDQTAKRFKISKENLISAIEGRKTLFGKQDKDRGKYIAYMRSELAYLLKKDDFVINTYAAFLLPRRITHILRVCLVGDFDWRVSNLKKNNVSEKDARLMVKDEDATLYQWVNYLYGMNPWDKRLYDIIEPMHDKSIDEAVDLIIKYAKKDVLKPNEQSLKLVKDFQLSSKVNAFLADKKHDVSVESDNGKVTVYIEKYSLRLEHYKNEIKELVETMDGVKEVEVTIGKKINMPSAFPPVDFDIPKKILLVDDEVEFVQTLSERLQTRKFESKIAYDGEQALSSIDEDVPEVMVLDLKMPGIGGLEVLKEVKEKHPETEIIILTGHGSEKEKEKAFELGAFAYLEKPVNINVLSDTMKKAYAKINRTRIDT
jgi:two-component system response regulator CpxR